MARKLKCRHCGEYEYADKGIRVPLGFFCSMDHVSEYGLTKAKAAQERKRKKESKAIEEKLKSDRRNLKQAKESLRDRSWYLKECQKWFNKFIRLRDFDQTCISCERHHQGQYHAGHFRSVGSTPELRFEELNCHKQCAPCNNHLSGNIVNYRPNLINKIGKDKVDWIEGPHDPKKYSVEDLKAMIFEYKEKCKQLEKDNQSCA